MSAVIPGIRQRSTDSPWGCLNLMDFRGGSIDTSKVSVPTIDNIDERKPSYNFSLYQPGDGSERDLDRIPQRYLSMLKGNRPAALAALNATLKWRQEHRIDTILQEPHANFDIYKAASVHYFLGRDATGHVVFLQRPALDSRALFRLAKRNHCLNVPEMILHYAYVMEYLWNVLDPPTPCSSNNKSDGSIRSVTTIIDLTGIDLSILRQRELLGFVKQFVLMTTTHYPQRAYKTLIVNAPPWFQQVYRMIAPLLRENTKAKIEILRRQSQHQVDVLRQVLGDDLMQYLPPELLVTDQVYHQVRSIDGNRNHARSVVIPPMETQFREFVLARLQEAGMEMNSLV